MSRFVGIEHHHRRELIALQQAGVRGAEGGAQRCHGRHRQAGKGHDVGVALHHHHPRRRGTGATGRHPGGAGRAAAALRAGAQQGKRVIQPEELLILAKEGSLGGVDVLRRSLGGERTAAERQHLAARVDDREHQPAPEQGPQLRRRGVPGVAAAAREEARLGQEPVGKLLAAEELQQPAVSRGRPAQLECRNRLWTDAASFQVAASRRGFAGGTQHVMEGLRDSAVELHVFAPRNGTGRPLLRLQLDAGALRQHAHRLRERELLHIHDELDQSAPLATAEAVERRLVGRHRERRGLFGVERAQSPVTVAALAQRQVLPDHVDDIQTVDDLGDLGFRNAHGPVTERSPSGRRIWPPSVRSGHSRSGVPRWPDP